MRTPCLTIRLRRQKSKRAGTYFFRSGPLLYLDVLASSGELYIFTFAWELSCVR